VGVVRWVTRMDGAATGRHCVVTRPAHTRDRPRVHGSMHAAASGGASLGTEVVLIGRQDAEEIPLKKWRSDGHH